MLGTVHLYAYLSVNFPLGKICEESSSLPVRGPPSIIASSRVSSTLSVSPKISASSWNLTCLIGLTRLTRVAMMVDMAIQAHPTSVHVLGNSLQHSVLVKSAILDAMV